MRAEGQVLRVDPAEELHRAEAIERLRLVDGVLVEALLDPEAYTSSGRINASALARLTGRTKHGVLASLRRLWEVAT